MILSRHGRQWASVWLPTTIFMQVIEHFLLHTNKIISPNNSTIRQRLYLFFGVLPAVAKIVLVEWRFEIILFCEIFRWINYNSHLLILWSWWGESSQKSQRCCSWQEIRWLWLVTNPRHTNCVKSIIFMFYIQQPRKGSANWILGGLTLPLHGTIQE